MNLVYLKGQTSFLLLTEKVNTTVNPWLCQFILYILKKNQNILLHLFSFAIIYGQS